MLKYIPQCDGIGRWGLWEVLREGLEEAISALQELKSHRSLLSVDGSRTQEKRNLLSPHTVTLFCSKVLGSHRIL